MSYDKQHRLHYEVMNLGLRAQATSVGLVQLCIELRHANLLNDDAIERIKIAIADEVSLAAPPTLASRNYRQDVKARLDRLFAGEEKVGSAEDLSLGAAR